jgi:hypothetical protein
MCRLAMVCNTVLELASVCIDGACFLVLSCTLLVVVCMFASCMVVAWHHLSFCNMAGAFCMLVAGEVVAAYKLVAWEVAVACMLVAWEPIAVYTLVAWEVAAVYMLVALEVQASYMWVVYKQIVFVRVPYKSVVLGCTTVFGLYM